MYLTRVIQGHSVRCLRMKNTSDESVHAVECMDRFHQCTPPSGSTVFRQTIAFLVIVTYGISEILITDVS